MMNNIGGYEVPITLKQLEAGSSSLTKSTEPELDKTPGKILESFGNILKKQIQETNQIQKDSEKAQETFATGGNVSLHEVMLKAEKAEMAMQLTLQLRNKLISAYKEIQSMHV